MLKKTLIWTAALGLVSSELYAQSEASVAASTNDGSGGFSEYNEKYKPEANLFELGVYTGLIFPASDHNIYTPRLTQQEYAGASAELGVRFGFFPLPYLGIEVDAMNSPTSVDTGQSAMLYSFGGRLVGQLHTMSLTPFVLLGAGYIGGISEPMGNDADPALSFGAGIKAPLTEAVSIRLDIRDTLSQKFGAAGGDQTHHPEILLGATITLGRSKSSSTLPPPDSDRDGLPDTEDKCPRDGALTPDGCPLDTDGDGVLDRDDHCPRESGDQADGCVNPDKDGDGVPSPADKCENEKGQAPDGCPVRDSDGDGFLDDTDKCPDKPETKNGFDDADGCPDEVPEDVKSLSGVVEGMLFVYNQATILPRSYAVLDKAVAVLQKYPALKLEVSSHVTEADKQKAATLSTARAEAVKKYLTDKGVAADRIKARGAGTQQPLADPSAAGAAQKNERVEFKLLP
jgi:OOP family OmpA-OmpF porin